MRGVLVLLIAIVGPGCAALAEPTRADDRDPRRIYILSNGWHTVIAVPQQTAVRQKIAAARDAPRGAYLLIGWGQRDYYCGSRSLWTFFKATSLPTASALHVRAVNGRLTDTFPRAEIYEVLISGQQLRELCTAVDAEFARRDGALVSLGDGAGEPGRYYLGHMPYYLPNTCNVWTARMLRRAGVQVRPPLALVADDLMAQLRPVARCISVLRRPAHPF